MNLLQNQEAELSLIGAAIRSKSCARKLTELPADLFTQPDTQAAQRAIARLLARDEGIDVPTLEAEISKEKIDAAHLVCNAPMMGMTTSMWGQWVALLEDCRKRRALLTAATQAANDARDPGEDPDKAFVRLAAAGKAVETKLGSVGMAEALAMLLETIGDKRKACQTGIADFDRLTGGLRGGKLVVIGARPGIGKTALAISMGKHVARHTGGVLIVSLEMSEEEIMARLFASESGVNVQELESGKLSDEGLDALARCGPVLSALPIRIATKCTTPLQIRQEAVKMRDNGGLEMVIVDYLQLLRTDRKHGSRYEEVSEISRELKLLSMDLGVPVLALTQFNRQSEGQNGTKKRAPSMAEAKDSGSIEQDANIFVVQWAPEEPGKDPYAQQAQQICEAQGWEWQQLNIQKNRQGRTGAINVGFDKAHMVFQNLHLSPKAPVKVPSRDLLEGL